MFSHYLCITAVAECGIGSSCLHSSSRHLTQDSSLLAALATVDVSLVEAQWCSKHLKMQAHSWSWCCNFCLYTFKCLVHQSLCSLLSFFLCLLIKEKNSQQFQNFCPCTPAEFWDISIFPKIPWTLFYSTAVIIVYFSTLVKLPFQEVTQFRYGIFTCLLRQENVGEFLSFASETCYSITDIGK